MSIEIEGKPIAWWSNEELVEYLDRMICTQGVTRDHAVMAEALSRSMAALISDVNSKAREAHDET
ncbi:MAG TPA: hypothetical protein VN517_03785 [Terriglobales bacterium]|nr:hypothetical protein [Terriglobales bacterium]